MTRLVARIALLCAPLFMLVLAAFHVQTPNPLPESAFGHCSTPCWDGIQPGITTRVEAVNTLTAEQGFDPATPVCYSPSLLPCEIYQWRLTVNTRLWTRVQAQQGIVTNFDTRFPGFTLGEALLALDKLDYSLYSFQVGYNHEWLYVWLSFADARISVSAQSTCPNSFFALMQTPIDTVAIQSPDLNRQHEPMTLGLLHQMYAALCESMNR